MKDQRIINVFMKRLWILTLFVALPMCLLAQQKTEYNRKGDEAMKRLDYSDARMWYEEGVVQCDPYSIEQLTSIWLANQRMRPSMHSLMNKCRACLELMANNEDTTAISQLIIYYTEGIGTSKNERSSGNTSQTGRARFLSFCQPNKARYPQRTDEVLYWLCLLHRSTLWLDSGRGEISFGLVPAF